MEGERMKVREVMGKPYVITPEASVEDAARMMSEKDISTLFVVLGKKVIGLLTDMDIIRRVVSSDKKPSEVKVSEVMTSRLITAEADDNIEDAVYKMQKNGIRRLPVTSKGRFIGILTTDYISAHA